MARSGIGGQVLVRLGDGVPERIDALAGKGGRSEFIRQAVLTALGDEALAFTDEPEPVKSEIEGVDRGEMLARAKVLAAAKSAAVVKPASTPDGYWLQDKTDLLAALKVRGMTAREAATALGWAPMRVEAVAKRLGSQIAFRAGGVMEVVEVGRP